MWLWVVLQILDTILHVLYFIKKWRERKYQVTKLKSRIMLHLLTSTVHFALFKTEKKMQAFTVPVQGSWHFDKLLKLHKFL